MGRTYDKPMQSPPFGLTFIITHECNLRCTYCYETLRDKQYANIEKIKEIISIYLNNPALGSVTIDFFGGEPWLKFDLIKEVCEWTWSQSWKNNYIFFTTTNGTLIHGEIKDWLRLHKEQFCCGLSLDGTKETHDKNRCNSFDRIDIQFFLECWPNQAVKMTISPQSIETLCKDIKYIQNLGFKLDGTNFAEGFDWTDTKYIKILSKELEKLVDFYLKHPDYEVAPILNMRLQNCESRAKTRKWCGTGSNMAVFDIDGREYPCTFFTPMTFNEDRLLEIKDIDFKDDEKFVDEDCYKNCYFYNICSNCYGANFLATGKVNKRDKSHCNLLKVRAYYAAALMANRILQNKDKIIDKNTTALQIRAIEKIKKICEEEFYL